ncbi:unnamed protein product [Arabidopsis halleri]
MSSRTRFSAAANALRKKKPSPSPAIEPTSMLLSLPYDLLLNCLARVSKLHYPTLSLVSKTFRSIIASPELYEARSIINRTESCLYLCLRFPLDPNTYWFTLCRTPNRGNLLVPIPSPHLPPTKSSCLVAVGSEIYKLGGDRVSSCRVSVLDCKSHKWRQAPSMRVDRSYSSTASSLDGKIYVAGGCEDVNFSNWVEVFDPKTQTWGSVLNPGIDKRDGGEIKSLGLDGKFYLFRDDEFVVYNPKEGRWNTIGLDSDMACAVSFSDSVVDEVLFFWDDGVFKWYDSKARLWKKLNGVEGLPDFCHCLMVDVGGKMMVLWDEFVYYSTRFQENVIWCAEISLERRGDGDEIWGKVEWFDAVLPVHKSCHLVYAAGLSATL